MRILYVSTWLPYPPDNGARIRAYNLLRYLAERHEVHLLSFMFSEDDEQYLPVLCSLCADVRVVLRDPFQLSALGTALGFLSPRPRGVVGTYCRDMDRAVCQVTERTLFDVHVAACAVAGRYLLRVPHVPRLLEEQNSSSRMAHESYRAERRTLPRLRRWVAWQKAVRYEHWLFPQFDACSMVSTADRDALLAAVPEMAGRVIVLPNGVDLERNRPGLADPQPDTLVFNGPLMYAPNAEAMRFFVTEVWPKVRRERPHATLMITGKSDGADLSWLPSDGSVRMCGYLEDVRPAVAGSWLSVVPLCTGGGTRLKILEALALGTPVVSTWKGAEGLDLAPGREVLIADEPGELAARTLQVLRDPALRERLSRNGRQAVEERYGWQRIGSDMDAWLRSVVAARQAAHNGKGAEQR
jgi:glycosyltransferase involved in cell wall biosynthesis